MGHETRRNFVLLPVDKEPGRDLRKSSTFKVPTKLRRGES